MNVLLLQSLANREVAPKACYRSGSTAGGTPQRSWVRSPSGANFSSGVKKTPSLVPRPKHCGARPNSQGDGPPCTGGAGVRGFSWPAVRRSFYLSNNAVGAVLPPAGQVFTYVNEAVNLVWHPPIEWHFEICHGKGWILRNFSCSRRHVSELIIRNFICVVMLCSPYNCLKLSCVASLDLRNRWSRFLVDDEQEEQREETNWSISSRSGKILVASGSYKPENERETKWMNLQKHTHISYMNSEIMTRTTCLPTTTRNRSELGVGN